MKKRPLRPLKNSYPIYKQISRKLCQKIDTNDFSHTFEKSNLLLLIIAIWLYIKSLLSKVNFRSFETLTPTVVHVRKVGVRASKPIICLQIIENLRQVSTNQCTKSFSGCGAVFSKKPHNPNL